MAFDNLLATANEDRAAWEQERSRLEDELRQLQVRSAEAERLLKDQLAQLHSVLEGTRASLVQLDEEHRALRNGSAGTIGGLQAQAAQLQRTVDQLQAANADLQQQLSSALVEASLKQEAQRRVAELEAGIAGLQQRARELISSLKHSRDAAEQHANQLSGELQVARGEVVQQAAARQWHENAALALALEQQRLLAALELERLINEPLRHTNYATTTLTHVMRSPVAASIQERSGAPLNINAASSPQGYPVPAHLDSTTVTRPGATAGARHSPVAGSSVTVTRPQMAGSLDGQYLTRLGRAWATTTTTAGLPHPTYLDNYDGPLTPPPPGPRRSPYAATPRPGRPQPHMTGLLFGEYPGPGSPAGDALGGLMRSGGLARPRTAGSVRTAGAYGGSPTAAEAAAALVGQEAAHRPAAAAARALWVPAGRRAASAGRAVARQQRRQVAPLQERGAGGADARIVSSRLGLAPPQPGVDEVEAAAALLVQAAAGRPNAAAWQGAEAKGDAPTGGSGYDVTIAYGRC